MPIRMKWGAVAKRFVLVFVAVLFIGMGVFAVLDLIGKTNKNPLKLPTDNNDIKTVDAADQTHGWLYSGDHASVPSGCDRVRYARVRVRFIFDSDYFSLDSGDNGYNNGVSTSTVNNNQAVVFDVAKSTGSDMILSIGYSYGNCNVSLRHAGIKLKPKIPGLGAKISRVTYGNDSNSDYPSSTTNELTLSGTTTVTSTPASGTRGLGTVNPYVRIPKGTINAHSRSVSNSSQTYYNGHNAATIYVEALMPTVQVTYLDSGLALHMDGSYRDVLAGAGGLTGMPNNGDETYEHGKSNETHGKAANGPTRNGYNFKEWRAYATAPTISDAGTLSGIDIYNPGEAFTSSTVKTSGTNTGANRSQNFNLYAVWTPKVFAIKYEDIGTGMRAPANGTDPDLSPPTGRSTSVSNQVEFNGSANPAAVTAATFSQWTIRCHKKKHWTTVDLEGEPFDKTTYIHKYEGSLDLLMYWEVDKASVTYNLEGKNGISGDPGAHGHGSTGTNGSKTRVISTYDLGEQFNLLAPSNFIGGSTYNWMLRGHTLEGWSYSATDLNDASQGKSGDYAITTHMTASDKTFIDRVAGLNVWAVWKAKTYTVTYNYNAMTSTNIPSGNDGSTAGAPTQAFTFGDDSALANLKDTGTFSRNGFILVGWAGVRIPFLDKDGKLPNNLTWESVTVDNNKAGPTSTGASKPIEDLRYKCTTAVGTAGYFTYKIPVDTEPPPNGSTLYAVWKSYAGTIQFKSEIGTTKAAGGTGASGNASTLKLPNITNGVIGNIETPMTNNNPAKETAAFAVTSLTKWNSGTENNLIPTLTGHDFQGWFIGPNGTTVTKLSDATIMVIDPKGKWVNNHNNATLYSKLSAQMFSNAGTSPIPNVSEDFGNRHDAEQHLIIGNGATLVLWAKWRGFTYQVRYDNGFLPINKVNSVNGWASTTTQDPWGAHETTTVKDILPLNNITNSVTVGNYLPGSLPVDPNNGQIIYPAFGSDEYYQRLYWAGYDITDNYYYPEFGGGWMAGPAMGRPSEYILDLTHSSNTKRYGFYSYVNSNWAQVWGEYGVTTTQTMRNAQNFGSDYHMADNTMFYWGQDGTSTSVNAVPAAQWARDTYYYTYWHQLVLNWGSPIRSMEGKQSDGRGGEYSYLFAQRPQAAIAWKGYWYGTTDGGKTFGLKSDTPCWTSDKGLNLSLNSPSMSGANAIELNDNEGNRQWTLVLVAQWDDKTSDLQFPGEGQTWDGSNGDVVQRPAGYELKEWVRIKWNGNRIFYNKNDDKFYYNAQFTGSPVNEDSTQNPLFQKVNAGAYISLSGNEEWMARWEKIDLIIKFSGFDITHDENKARFLGANAGVPNASNDPENVTYYTAIRNTSYNIDNTQFPRPYKRGYNFLGWTTRGFYDVNGTLQFGALNKDGTGLYPQTIAGSDGKLRMGLNQALTDQSMTGIPSNNKYYGLIYYPTPNQTNNNQNLGNNAADSADYKGPRIIPAVAEDAFVAGQYVWCPYVRSVTLFAAWDPMTYTVNYDLNNKAMNAGKAGGPDSNVAPLLPNGTYSRMDTGFRYGDPEVDAPRALGRQGTDPTRRLRYPITVTFENDGIGVFGNGSPQHMALSVQYAELEFLGWSLVPNPTKLDRMWYNIGAGPTLESVNDLLELDPLPDNQIQGFNITLYAQWGMGRVYIPEMTDQFSVYGVHGWYSGRTGIQGYYTYDKSTLLMPDESVQYNASVLGYEYQSEATQFWWDTTFYALWGGLGYNISFRMNNMFHDDPAYLEENEPRASDEFYNETVGQKLPLFSTMRDEQNQQFEHSLPIDFYPNASNGKLTFKGTTYGQSIPVSTQVRMVFVGWAEQRNGGGLLWNDGDPFGDPFEPNYLVITTRVKVLYAQWRSEELVEMPTVERAGYVWDGWNNDPYGTGALNFGLDPEYAFTSAHEQIIRAGLPPLTVPKLYAKYRPNYYNFTFWGNMPNVNQFGDQLEVLNGDVIANSFRMMPYVNGVQTAPTRAGYTFMGWRENINSGDTLTGPDGIFNQPISGFSRFDENLNALVWDLISGRNLYAKWEALTYTVSFNGNGFSGYNPGYNSMPSQTFTVDVEGVLSPNQFRLAYTITYNANGGSVRNYGWYETVDQLAPREFIGWKANNQGTIYDYPYTIQNGGKVYQPLKIFNLPYSLGLSHTSPVTMYAQWAPQTVLLESAFRQGYNFMGWSRNQNGAVGDPNFIGEWGDSYSFAGVANETLYAIWQPIGYQVIYEKNQPMHTTYKNIGGLTPAPEIPAFPANYTTIFNIASPANYGWNLEGWRFAGWNDNFMGIGNHYNAGQQITSPLTAEHGKTIPLYAIWLPWEYKVVFNGNGGVTKSIPDPNTGEETSAGYDQYNQTLKWDGMYDNIPSNDVNNNSTNGMPEQLVDNRFERKYWITYNLQTPFADLNNIRYEYQYINGNWEFVPVNYGNKEIVVRPYAGWNTQANGTGVPYADKDVLRNVVSVPTNNSLVYNLYAQWANAVVYLPEPSRTDGWNFGGWFTAPNGGGTRVGDAQWSYEQWTVALDVDTVLHAYWTPYTYNIEFHASVDTTAGEMNYVQVISSGLAANLYANEFEKSFSVSFEIDYLGGVTPNNVQATYNFSHWTWYDFNTNTTHTFTDEQSVGGAGNDLLPRTGTVHLYAVFSEQSNAIILPAATRVGYYMEYWYLIDSMTLNEIPVGQAGQTYQFAQGVSSGANLWAKWTPYTYNIFYNEGEGSEYQITTTDYGNFFLQNQHVYKDGKSGFYVTELDPETGTLRYIFSEYYTVIDPIYDYDQPIWGPNPLFNPYLEPDEEYNPEEIILDYVITGYNYTYDAVRPVTIEPTILPTVNDMSRLGHTFGGWYLDSTFQRQVTEINNTILHDPTIQFLSGQSFWFQSGVLSGTCDIQLFAKWTPNTITFVYDSAYTRPGNPIDKPVDQLFPEESTWQYGQVVQWNELIDLIQYRYVTTTPEGQVSVINNTSPVPVRPGYTFSHFNMYANGVVYTWYPYTNMRILDTFQSTQIENGNTGEDGFVPQQGEITGLWKEWILEFGEKPPGGMPPVVGGHWEYTQNRTVTLVPVFIPQQIELMYLYEFDIGALKYGERYGMTPENPSGDRFEDGHWYGGDASDRVSSYTYLAGSQSNYTRYTLAPAFRAGYNFMGWFYTLYTNDPRPDNPNYLGFVEYSLYNPATQLYEFNSSNFTQRVMRIYAKWSPIRLNITYNDGEAGVTNPINPDIAYFHSAPVLYDSNNTPYKNDEYTAVPYKMPEAVNDLVKAQQTNKPVESRLSYQDAGYYAGYTFDGWDYTISFTDADKSMTWARNTGDYGNEFWPANANDVFVNLPETGYTKSLAEFLYNFNNYGATNRLDAVNREFTVELNARWRKNEIKITFVNNINGKYTDYVNGQVVTGYNVPVPNNNVDTRILEYNEAVNNIYEMLTGYQTKFTRYGHDFAGWRIYYVDGITPITIDWMTGGRLANDSFDGFIPNIGIQNNELITDIKFAPIWKEVVYSVDLYGKDNAQTEKFDEYSGLSFTHDGGVGEGQIERDNQGLRIRIPYNVGHDFTVTTSGGSQIGLYYINESEIPVHIPYSAIDFFKLNFANNTTTNISASTNNLQSAVAKYTITGELIGYVLTFNGVAQDIVADWFVYLKPDYFEQQLMTNTDKLLRLNDGQGVYGTYRFMTTFTPQKLRIYYHDMEYDEDTRTYNPVEHLDNFMGGSMPNLNISTWNITSSDGTNMDDVYPLWFTYGDDRVQVFHPTGTDITFNGYYYNYDPRGRAAIPASTSAQSGWAIVFVPDPSGTGGVWQLKWIDGDRQFIYTGGDILTHAELGASILHGIHLYAKWQLPNEYTVTYDYNLPAEFNTANYAKWETNILPDYTGHVFHGSAISSEILSTLANGVTIDGMQNIGEGEEQWNTGAEITFNYWFEPVIELMAERHEITNEITGYRTVYQNNRPKIAGELVYDANNRIIGQTINGLPVNFGAQTLVAGVTTAALTPLGGDRYLSDSIGLLTAGDIHIIWQFSGLREKFYIANWTYRNDIVITANHVLGSVFNPVTKTTVNTFYNTYKLPHTVDDMHLVDGKYAGTVNFNTALATTASPGPVSNVGGVQLGTRNDWYEFMGWANTRNNRIVDVTDDVLFTVRQNENYQAVWKPNTIMLKTVINNIEKESRNTLNGNENMELFNLIDAANLYADTLNTFIEQRLANGYYTSITDVENVFAEMIAHIKRLAIRINGKITFSTGNQWNAGKVDTSRIQVLLADMQDYHEALTENGGNPPLPRPNETATAQLGAYIMVIKNEILITPTPDNVRAMERNVYNWFRDRGANYFNSGTGEIKPLFASDKHKADFRRFAAIVQEYYTNYTNVTLRSQVYNYVNECLAKLNSPSVSATILARDIRGWVDKIRQDTEQTWTGSDEIAAAEAAVNGIPYKRVVGASDPYRMPISKAAKQPDIDDVLEMGYRIMEYIHSPNQSAMNQDLLANILGAIQLSTYNDIRNDTLYTYKIRLAGLGSQIAAAFMAIGQVLPLDTNGLPPSVPFTGNFYNIDEDFPYFNRRLDRIVDVFSEYIRDPWLTDGHKGPHTAGKLGSYTLADFYELASMVREGAIAGDGSVTYADIRRMVRIAQYLCTTANQFTSRGYNYTFGTNNAPATSGDFSRQSNDPNYTPLTSDTYALMVKIYEEFDNYLTIGLWEQDQYDEWEHDGETYTRDYIFNVLYPLIYEANDYIVVNVGNIVSEQISREYIQRIMDAMAKVGIEWIDPQKPPVPDPATPEQIADLWYQIYTLEGLYDAIKKEYDISKYNEAFSMVYEARHVLPPYVEIPLMVPVLTHTDILKKFIDGLVWTTNPPIKEPPSVEDPEYEAYMRYALSTEILLEYGSAPFDMHGLLLVDLEKLQNELDVAVAILGLGLALTKEGYEERTEALLNLVRNGYERPDGTGGNIEIIPPAYSSYPEWPMAVGGRTNQLEILKLVTYNLEQYINKVEKNPDMKQILRNELATARNFLAGLNNEPETPVLEIFKVRKNLTDTLLDFGIDIYKDLPPDKHDKNNNIWIWIVLIITIILVAAAVSYMPIRKKVKKQKHSVQNA